MRLGERSEHPAFNKHRLRPWCWRRLVRDARVVLAVGQPQELVAAAIEVLAGFLAGDREAAVLGLQIVE